MAAKKKTTSVAGWGVTTEPTVRYFNNTILILILIMWRVHVRNQRYIDIIRIFRWPDLSASCFHTVSASFPGS